MGTDVNLLLVFGAGLASVLSPCVLPVLPVVVTGSGDDHRSRPLFIVSGLALTFMMMGILSVLFGAAIGGAMQTVEKVAGVIIIIFGLLMILRVNLFKYLTLFSRFNGNSKGRWGGFVLGLTLGVIWIPCIGPMLSGVLAVVAVEGKILSGSGLLLIYSLGFALPMLVAAYASQFFRARFRTIGRYPYLINVVSGVILIAFGAFILWKGMVGFGTW